MNSAALAQDVEEEAPKYLLGDLGVRVDLPSGWNVTRWSDWDLKAESVPAGVLLFAWTTPFQIEPVQENLGSWGRIAEKKAKELKGVSPAVTQSELVALGGVSVAMTEVSFHFESDSGPMGWLYSASLPVEGQMFHVATVAAANRKGLAKRKRDEVLKRLDVRAKAASLDWGATLSASGVQSQLPKDWRPPLEIEIPFLESQFKLLGISDAEACWTAIQPAPIGEPSVMVTCPGSLYLGVVDEHSFEGVDVEVRKGLFGSAPVAAGRKLELSDRLAFVYQPPLGDRQLVVGAVPYERGIARTWALGPEGSAALSSVLETTLRGSQYEGSHPTGATDLIAYAFKYRLMLVLVPLLLVGLGLLSGFWYLFSGGRKKTYGDLEQMLD